MQLIGFKDPSLGKDHFSTGVAQAGGVVILHNLSPYDLKLTFDNDPTRQTTLMAWQPREFDFCGHRTADIEYEYLYPGTGTTQSNPPSSIIIGEAFAPGAPIPKSNPNYDRLSNLGNSSGIAVSTTDQVINDGETSGTTVVESTPSGSGLSTLLMKNDGTVQLAALSNGALVALINITPGGLSTPAQLILKLLSVIGAASLDNGNITTDGAGSVVQTGSTTLHGLEVYPLPGSGDDSVVLWDRNSVAGIVMGWAQGGVGWYVYDLNHGGYIIDGATKDKLPVSGLLSANQVKSALQVYFGVGSSGIQSFMDYDSTNHINTYWTPMNGVANGHMFIVWNGSAQTNLFSVGAGLSGASTVDLNGHFNDNGHAVPYNQSAGGGAAGRVNWYGTTDPGGSANEGDSWDAV